MEAGPVIGGTVRSSQSLDRTLVRPRDRGCAGQREYRSIKQFGALPYRNDDDGTLRILLITSRDTRRWIIPKGNPISGLRPYETAAREAFEEAGVSGAIERVAVGAFTYSKRCKDGRRRSAQVSVYPLAVTQVAQAWPEQHERDKCWFEAHDAVDAVDEESLRHLIRIFRERM
jgi:8-oxo-dGTP pyrophosphatase MutT (NUDIX family)